jgi:hypothetical protein
MNELKTNSSSWASNSTRNTARLRYWTIAWLATTALAAYGPKWLWDFDTLLTILGVVINLGVGFGMIVATRNHLQGLDEMQQKIFLDAAALSLGAGLVFGIGYELLEDIKLISFEPDISHLIILMSLTFIAGIIAGHRKYR